MAIGSSSTGISITTTVIGHWFRQKIGLAVGIMVCGHGASGLLLPIIVKLIELYDWRVAVLILAVGLIILGLPLTLVVRSRPEPYGFLPDGEDDSFMSGGALASVTEEKSVSATAAFRSPTLWYIVLALFPQFIAVGAVFTHVMPYLSSVGITLSLSSLVTTSLPLVSIGGRFGMGWFSDQFSKKLLSTGALVALALGLVFFEYTTSETLWFLVIFVIFFGISYGGNLAMLSILLRSYFGRGSYGTIIGFTWGILLLGNVVGPPLAGWFFDTWGSYRYVWLMMAGIVLIGALFMATTPVVGNKRR
jgi:sugar phosphate permease